MTHPRNAQPAGADAEKAAFLRDLRALRDQAGLQTSDLAARAHYPEDTLRAAEDGPALPSLPVLEAYVRGCGAQPSDWEERCAGWRSCPRRS
jgi:DNA-binding XRE family transcriptional regulator